MYRPFQDKQLSLPSYGVSPHSSQLDGHGKQEAGSAQISLSVTSKEEYSLRDQAKSLEHRFMPCSSSLLPLVSAPIT